MKFSCLSENLSKGLNIVGRTVSTRSALPILSHIYIKAQKGQIKLSATNLEIGVNYLLTGKVEKEGEITIPARILLEFVGTVGSGKIEVGTKDMVLNIKSEKTEANVSGGDPAEFPLIPDIKDKKSFSLPADDFREAIQLVAVAAAQDETRPILSGVLFKVTGDSLVMAATDSYRLSEKSLKIKSSAEGTFEVIVPAKTLQEVGRILGETNGEVKVYLSENQISFQLGEDIELVSRLIEGQFPNYKQIIPEKTETKATAELTELTSALKVAYLFARESANTMKVEFKPKTGLEITATAAGLGDTTSTVPAKVEGAEGEISLNVRYVLDALANLKSKEVTLEISGKLSPAIIHSKDVKDYLYIVMPLRS